MKVKLLTRMADTSGVRQPGDVLEGSADDLRPLLEGGYAVPIVEEKREDAVVTATEMREEVTEEAVKPKRKYTRRKKQGLGDD